MIELKNINKIYSKNSKNSFHALKDINLKIDDGELISIIGESGAGKSTLLHILSCVESFDGEYLMDGKNIAQYKDKQLSKLRNSDISIVLQNFALIGDFTVFENCLVPLYFNQNIKNKKEAVNSALKSVCIENLTKKKASQLSGGQKQRVAIARALVTKPKYIFADEPTGSLDSKTSEEIINILFELNKQGIAVIIVTHNLKLANACRRLIELKDGIIIRDININ